MIAVLVSAAGLTRPDKALNGALPLKCKGVAAALDVTPDQRVALAKGGVAGLQQVVGEGSTACSPVSKIT